MSRLFVCTSIYDGSSLPSPIERLHRRHHHCGPALHAVDLTNRSRANHPPETSVVHCMILRQARGLPLRRLLEQQHHCLSSSSSLHLHVVDTCKCTSLTWSYSVVQVLRRLQAPPSCYNDTIKDLLPMRRGSPAATAPETSMCRHAYLFAFVQHNLVASVAVSSSPL